MLLHAWAPASSVDQNEPNPGMENKPGAETIDVEHRDEDDTQPAQVVEEDNSAQADEDGWIRRQR